MTDLAADEGETLDTGCLASTPAGDNLLLDFARGHAACFAAIAGAAGGRVDHVGALGLHLADVAMPSPFGNTVHFTRPIAAFETRMIASTLHEYFESVPGGPFLVFSPWPIEDLSHYGFHLVGHPPLMMRAPSVPRRDGNPALRVEAVTTADGLVEYERTLVEAYPAPEMQPFVGPRLFLPAALDTGWRLFAGYEGDRCVATAAAWPTDSVTIVEQVSVRDDCRGKGYGTAITAAATHAVADRTAMLIASDLGRPIYDALGYLPLLRYTLYIGMRS
jgi:GNAT superfamily N-acetyltransferase